MRQAVFLPVNNGHAAGDNWQAALVRRAFEAVKRVLGPGHGDINAVEMGARLAALHPEELGDLAPDGVAGAGRGIAAIVADATRGGRLAGTEPSAARPATAGVWRGTVKELWQRGMRVMRRHVKTVDDWAEGAATFAQLAQVAPAHFWAQLNAGVCYTYGRASTVAVGERYVRRWLVRGST